MRFRGFLIYGLFLLPFLVELQVPGIWDSNEAFYIQTPREMAERGDWIVPYFNRQPRLNKPPLSYWLVGMAQAGISDPIVAERWVLGAVAAASLFCCWGLARLLSGDSAVAFLAMGILATCFRFLVLSRRLLIDTLLLLCLLGALTAFVEWLRTRERTPFLLMSAALALGFLAKGPVVGIGAMALLLYLLLTGLWRELGKAPLGWALLLACLICLPWYLLLAQRLGVGVLLDFFVRENLGRFTHLDYGPDRGIFYYGGVFLADFAPWSLLFLAAFPWIWERLRGEWRSRGSSLQLGNGSVPAPALLMVCWIGLWMIFFSLSRNKQEYYILPVYPVAACWLSVWLAGHKVSKPWAVLATLPPLLATALVSRLGVSWLEFPAAAWILLVFPAAFGFLVFSNRWLAAAAVLSVLFSICLILFSKPLEEFRPVREFAARIEAEAAPRAAVGYYRLASPSLVVYLDRQIAELSTLVEAREFLDSPGEAWLVVEESDFRALQRVSSTRLEIRERRPLLSTRLKNILQRLRSSGENSVTSYALLVRKP